MYGSAQGNMSSDGRSGKGAAQSAFGFGRSDASSIRMREFLDLDVCPILLNGTAANNVPIVNQAIFRKLAITKSTARTFSGHSGRPQVG
jgi:hypothetical protein